MFGGREWRGVSPADEWIAHRCAGAVTVVPTAAAYERPATLVDAATEVFGSLGCEVRAVPLLRRSDASRPEVLDALGGAEATYLVAGSPMHLRSVLASSPAGGAISARWNDGGVLCASGESAGALSAVMVDPRGGAFTVGLGLFDSIAVCGRLNTWSDERLHRTVELAAPDLTLVGIDDGTALVWDATGGASDGGAATGAWSVVGDGRVVCYRGGVEIGIADLDSL